MDYKKLYEQTLAENKKLKEELEEKEEEVSLINSEEMENEEKIAELEKENEQLKKKNEEQQLIIDCHLAELEFTEASALDVPMEFNDWLKSKYYEEKYKQMYDCFNLYEYLEDEEDEDQ